jgi:uncharacterized protein YodC (DUF2158 family)
LNKLLQDIREGDLIRLSFGGQKMTVLKFEGDGAICGWTAGEREQVAWVAFACMKRVGKIPQRSEIVPARKLHLSGTGLFKP